MLYRGMDRDQLDAAYNNSDAVSNYAEIKADWQARSARVRQGRLCHLDLHYADTRRERLDLFLTDSPRAPTLVFIHGGYWQRNDKEEYSFVAEGPLARGINVAVLEYTLAPDARLDRIVSEIDRAALWLAGHLGEYGADQRRIYLAGHSAGGHLTAIAMGQLNVLSGGIAISGLFDLEPIRLSYLNVKLGLNADEARRNSPILRMPTQSKPLVVAYGTAELPELCRQSIDYGHAWIERGLPGYVLPVLGANHFTVLESLASPEGALTHALLEMMAA